jgi:hypothetical protein
MKSKPTFTNNANRFCKPAGTAGGIEVGAAGTDSGLKMVGCSE